MKADAFDIPSGHTLRSVRDFLRKKQGYSYYADYFCRDVVRHFGADITDELLAKKLIKHDDDDKTLLFQVSTLGLRLANVRLLPRISRAKANNIVVDMLERALAINSTEELLCRIKKIVAFGSYITDATDLGDIDIQVELEIKPNWSSAASHERARASGRSMNNYTDSLMYAHTEVLRLLKARNLYISFNQDGEGLDTPTKTIFEAQQKEKRK